jgi:thiamine kinase-like enzyme
MRICRLFSSLRNALKELNAFYKSKHHLRVLDYKIPYSLCFDGHELTEVKNEVRLVYSAILGSAEVIVKFTESYCFELHDLLANNNMAPKILKTFTIKPYWNVIVMERLNLVEIDSDHLTEHRSELNEKVSNILNLMREHNFVHGDLRSSNVFGELDEYDNFSGRVIVIDFDWSGKQGEATYPVDMSPFVDWPKGCEAGAPLEFEHDKYWADSFFKSKILQ